MFIVNMSVEYYTPFYKRLTSTALNDKIFLWGDTMIQYKFDVLYVLKAHGYSQYKLKQEKILSASAIAALKDNKTNITLESLDTICRLLNMQPGDILKYSAE